MQVGTLLCGFHGHGFSFHLVFDKASAKFELCKSHDVNAGLATYATLAQVTELTCQRN